MMTEEEKMWLNSENHKILLLEVAYHNGQDVEVLYFSTSSYISPQDSPFTDLLGVEIPHSVPYFDVITSVPRITSRLDSSSDLGSVEILNTTGEFDYLLEGAWIGHPYKLYLSNLTFDHKGFFLLSEGFTNGLAAPTSASLSISILDKKRALDVDVQTSLFTETSVTASITGSTLTGVSTSLIVVPETILQTPKPICLGKVFNVTPVLIDTYNQIYQCNDGEVANITAVRANGVDLPIGSSVQIDNTSGIFKLEVGNNEGNQITCDVEGSVARGVGFDSETPISAYSAKHLIEWLLLNKTTLGSSDISYTNFVAYEDDSVLSLYLSSQTKVSGAISRILSTLGTFGRFDRALGYSIYKLEDPASGTSVLDLVEDDIGFNSLRLQEVEPPKRIVEFKVARNWSVQNKDSLAGVVTDVDPLIASTERTFLEKLTTEYTSISGTNNVTAEYPFVEEDDPIETLFYSSTDAQVELDRRVALRGVKRFVFSMDSFSIPFGVEIGDVISLTHNRYIFSETRKCIVTKLEVDPVNKRTKLEVWT
jgi:hypothetical protein